MLFRSVMPDWRQTEVLVRYRFRLRSGNSVSESFYGDNKILNDDTFMPFGIHEYIGKMLECDIQTFALPGYTGGANIEIQIKQQNSPNLINAPYSLTIPSDSGDGEYLVEFTV